jgi:hypothetical protein
MKGEIIQEVLVVVKGMGSRAEGRKITRKKGRKEDSRLLVLRFGL